MKFCPQCGIQNNDFNFCPSCGFNFTPLQNNVDNQQINKNFSNVTIDKKSSIWDKIKIDENDIEIFLEFGTGADIFDDDYPTEFPINIKSKIDSYYLTESIVVMLKENAKDECSVIDLSNGILYAGQLKHNFKNGKGALLYKMEDGRYCITYYGEWKNDQKNGIGIEINEIYGVPTYKGNWTDNQWDGEGIIFLSHKGKYVGNIVAGSKNGYGVEYYENGYIMYEGDWVEGVKQGKGKEFFWSENGKIRYEGDWFEDKPNGKGKIIDTDGSIYEGYVLNGFRHGIGTLFLNFGSYSCNWDNDIPISEVIHINKNGERKIAEVLITKDADGNVTNFTFVADQQLPQNTNVQQNSSPIPPKDGAGIR